MNPIIWIVIAIVAIIIIVGVIALIMYLSSDDNGNGNNNTTQPEYPYEDAPIESLNPFLSVQCDQLEIDQYGQQNCTNVSYDIVTGIVSAECRASPEEEYNSTTLNMANCDNCTITAYGNRLGCSLDYSNCGNTVIVDDLDIMGSNHRILENTSFDECEEACLEDPQCSYANYRHDLDLCVPKKPRDIDTDFTSGIKTTATNGCAEYYVLPHGRPMDGGSKVSSVDHGEGHTLFQCRDICSNDPNCDWYEYRGDNGQCNTVTGNHGYDDAQTILPIAGAYYNR